MGTGALPIPEALRTRLRAEPKDRESWLVFADWLTDRGDIRGQLITLEDRIEHETLSQEQRDALGLERNNLLLDGYDGWFRGWEPPDDLALEWWGGFVVGVTLHGKNAIRAFCSLTERSTGQFLASASFHHVHESWPRLFDCSALGRLSSLRIFRCGLHAKNAALLAASPHITNLRSLDLGGSGIGPEGAAALAASPHLGNLRTLRLAGNRLGVKGVAGLGSSALRALNVLDLSDNKLKNQGLVALLGARACPELTSLDLSCNEISDWGIEQLADAETPSSLERLSLASNRIGAGGARALARARRLRSLRELDLRKNRIGGEDIELLRRSEFFADCRIWSPLPESAPG